MDERISDVSSLSASLVKLWPTTYLPMFFFFFFFLIFRFQSPSLYHEFTFTYFSCLLSFILFRIISNAHLLLMNKILLRSAAKIGGEIAYCEAMTTGKNKFPQCFRDVGRSKKAFHLKTVRAAMLGWPSVKVQFSKTSVGFGDVEKNVTIWTRHPWPGLNNATGFVKALWQNYKSSCLFFCHGS